MKLDVIENSGPDNLRDMLKAKLHRAVDVSIAVAFVTQSGLDELLQSLRQVAAGGTVRLVTGLYQKVTEPRALRTLLRVQEETRGAFSVRVSTEPQFHRKLYILRTKTHLLVFIGSSNLTREGLRSGGELNSLISLPKGSLTGKGFTSSFDNDWDHRAVPLVEEQIARYEKARPESRPHEHFPKGELTKILGAAPLHRQAQAEDINTDYWRDCITGLARKTTHQVISETTNWDEKKYWWYCPGPHTYKIGDRLFLFDFYDKQVRFVEIKDIAHRKVPTPDGCHFVAYKPVDKSSRRFTKRMWAQFGDEGINKKNAQSRRKLDPAKAEQLKPLLCASKRRRR